MTNGIKEGVGTAQDPFIIRDEADLLALDTWGTSGFFAKQIGDITFTNPVARNRLVTSSLTYNGNGFSINNLTLTGAVPATNVAVAIFTAGSVKNIKFNNLRITSSYEVSGIIDFGISVDAVHVKNANYTANTNASGLTRYVSNNLSDSSFSGTIVAGANASGLASVVANNSSIIERCSFSGQITGSNNVGGIIQSQSFNHAINDCYVDAKLIGTSPSTIIGGIIGNKSSSISILRCYSKGEISGYANMGGLFGSLSGTASHAKDCFVLMTKINRISGTATTYGDVYGFASGSVTLDNVKTINTIQFTTGVGG